MLKYIMYSAKMHFLLLGMAQNNMQNMSVMYKNELQHSLTFLSTLTQFTIKVNSIL